MRNQGVWEGFSCKRRGWPSFSEVPWGIRKVFEELEHLYVCWTYQRRTLQSSICVLRQNVVSWCFTNRAVFYFRLHQLLCLFCSVNRSSFASWKTTVCQIVLLKEQRDLSNGLPCLFKRITSCGQRPMFRTWNARNSQDPKQTWSFV